MKKIFVISLFIVTCSFVYKTFCQQSNDVQQSVELYAFRGGHSLINDKCFIHDAYSCSDTINLSVTSFLIKHPQGNLIWDTGMPFNERQIKEQIEAAGINSLNEIDFLAFSHWHYDHTGTANLFRHSTIISQRNEYEYAFSNEASIGFGMKPETYNELINNPTILLDGKLDVFGDDSVLIYRVGGHTMGSQILQLKLKDKTIILSGDIYHFKEQRTYKRVPKFNYNYLETVKAMDFIENLLKKTPNSELWITHDPEQMEQLIYSPKYYK